MRARRRDLQMPWDLCPLDFPVVVRPIGLLWLPPLIACGITVTFHKPVHIQHPGRRPEDEEKNHHPGFRAQGLIQCKADQDTDDKRRNYVRRHPEPETGS